MTESAELYLKAASVKSNSDFSTSAVSMRKIVILQPGYAHYRDELFKILSERFDISVVLDTAENTYPDKADAARTKGQAAIRLRPKPIGVIDAILREKPEVIVSNVSTSARTVTAFLYALFFRKKIVLWMEEWREGVYRGITPKSVFCRFRRLVGRKIIARCDAVIAGGTKAREYVLSKRGNSRGVFMARQCAVDQQKQPVCGETLEKGWASGFTFLYLGRIVPYKGLDILIKAFARLRMQRNDVFLLVAGEGEFRAECEKLCRILKIDGVKFLGAVEPARAKDVYALADVFVLPGRVIGNLYEGWGLVINEAMSMGLPVITTDSAGAAFDMVVPGFNGMIVPNGNVDELFRAMARIIELDLPLMGINSRKIFERKNNYGKMADVFTNAILYALGIPC